MKNLFTSALAATLILASAGTVLADSANWDEEKIATIAQNRHANSGLGNGGEGADGFEKPNEVGSNADNPDLDPGKSGAQCQGGKNNAANGDAC